METGEYVLNEVFHGRLDEAKSRDPDKDRSLTEICKAPELRITRRYSELE